MAYQDLPRWSVASMAKHLLASAEADSIEAVVDLINTRTPTWESAAINVEFTLDGPRLTTRTKGKHRADLDVFAIVSTVDNGTTAGNDHITAVGKIASYLQACVLVYNLGNEAGDDGLTLVGQFKPNNGDTGIVPVNLKPARSDDRLHSTVSGTFQAVFTT